MSYVLETAAFTISIAYNVHLNNPFSTYASQMNLADEWISYGEGVFIWLQNLVIMALLCGYARQFAGLVVSTFGFGVFAYWLMHGVSQSTLLLLQWSTVFIGIARYTKRTTSLSFNAARSLKLYQIGAASLLDSCRSSPPFCRQPVRERRERSLTTRYTGKSIHDDAGSQRCIYLDWVRCECKWSTSVVVDQ